MGFNNLPQLARTIRTTDGTVIHCQSVFGQDTISITVPVRAVGAAEGMVVREIANRVVDYVGVAMPNPVPYRGVSIGVVDKGIPHPRSEFPTGGYYWTNGLYGSPQYIPGPGGDLPITLNITSTANGVTSVVSSTQFQGTQPSQEAVTSGTYSYIIYVQEGNGTLGHVMSGLVSVTDGHADNLPLSAVFDIFGAVAAITSAGDAQYAAQLAADVSADIAGAKTYVMTSDGTVLASEVQNTTGGHTYYVPNTVWNGDAYCNMHVDDTSTPVDHQLTFTVPEDCIYPVPATPPDIFNTRRTAWFKKNSDETIAALPTAALPASWDYQVKTQIDLDYTRFRLADNSFAGRHTVMPLIMSVDYVDVVESDTSAGLTQAGTMVSRRTTTFEYTDANGVSQSAVVNGYLTQVVTRHNNSSGSQLGLSHTSAYQNWYALNLTQATTSPYGEFPDGTQYNDYATFWYVGADAGGLSYQFVVAGEGRSADAGLVWNGSVQSGYASDSKWRPYTGPANPLTYAGYTPPVPAYSNTLVGTAAPLYLQYHNTVLPEYVSDTAQSSTVMNNSAMFHIRQVELIPFSLISPDGANLGMFADPSETDTQVEVTGKAIYDFDWQTGALTFNSWRALDTPAIVTVTGRPDYNCLVGYVWDTPDEMWPDVAEYLRTKISMLKDGTWPDPNLYPLIKAMI
ncbi:MAG: hypothetical protein WC736_15855 [Gallionella sp.]